MTHLAMAICVFFAPVAVFAQDPPLPAADPIELLAAGRYTELDNALSAVQAQYRRGATTDERLLATFRPFYYLTRPDIEQHLDAWVRDKPASYVARLARGIHYKYQGLYPVVDASIEYPVEARLRMRKQAYARAVEDLTASLEFDDKPLLSYHHLMDEKDSLLWYSSNRRLLGKAIAIDPGTLIVRRKYLISLAPRSGGSLEAMDEYVQKCREEGLPPGHIAKLAYTVAVERAVRSFARETDYADAARRYASLMAIDPTDGRPAELYVAALQKLGKCDEVIDVATHLLSIDPRSDDALNNRGICFVRQEKFAEGLRDYRAAAALESVWAQKELARLLWQGRLVSQDRVMALRFLRRAAENGDTEARQEYERATGEPIRRKRPFWHSLILCALVGVPLAAIGTMTARRRRLEQESSARRLDHSPKKFVVGATALAFFGGLFLASMVFPSNWYPFWPAVILGGFSLASLWQVAAYLFVRHDLELDGIHYTRFDGARRRLAWRDVRRVRYHALSNYFVLDGKSGAAVRISDELRNLHLFASEVLARVPGEIIDEDAAILLDHLMRFHGREDWSPSDISVQESAAGSRLAMLGGTRGYGLALFSTDALPDFASLDSGSLEALEQAHQIVPFGVIDAGPYLLHAYFDTDVPVGVDKYALALTRRSARLVTKTGGIAFGGMESMYAGYQEREEIRFDARIPAGEYDVQSVLMSYPDAMIRAAMNARVGRMSMLVMTVLPYMILAAAIAGILAAVPGAWWLTGGAAALLVTLAALRYRSAWRRNFEQRTRDVAVNFPQVVACLRRRVGER